MFIQIIIGIDDRDYADLDSHSHMMIQFSDDEDNMNLNSGSGQITFGNESLNVTNSSVIFNDLSFDHNLSNFTMANNHIINISTDTHTIAISSYMCRSCKHYYH